MFQRLCLVSLVGLGSLALPSFAQPTPTAAPAAPAKTVPATWDVAALQSATITPEWGETKGLAREVYYAGEPFRGKPTRIFAYYAKPEGKGPFPAMVLVHGGGGTAFQAWAEHWAKRGYCAIAMDLAGKGPKGRLPDGGPDQDDGGKFGAFTESNYRDMWSYHAVAAAIRAHTLIRSFPEVDRDRIGLTGISWGGYLTCIISGVDHRFQAAVPVYGCGFLQDNSVWKPNRFDKMSPEQRDLWIRYFEPSQYLGSVKCPILFLNGTNDFAYPMDSYQKSYNLVQSPRTISVRVRLPHGHIWTFPEVDTFIDSHLKSGKPVASVGPLMRMGDQATAKVNSAVPLQKAMLHFAEATGPWQTRKWSSMPAMLDKGTISATIPTDRPLVVYLSVIDERGVEISSNHEVIAKP
ncbi:alpha/beta hydrolase family protein [Tuwongella immobilis]|uniref:Acetyl xylan esterase domain-containing protein n=1 Tax=Tuwongella immobilis TaxID=692036 RepID=A0A6C2YLA2_9BACT|nr:acetylxylan esterase [Tuwongella immobilis]VIP02009.1 Acetyl xylan esterase (AXE1)/PhoPQ-activated pathogenicity-related protein OS=Singulisphaera acidiphila (strain ATCC BAA-1392 / DSM 18658 / VKM B-2454 / MOB10) GN=Sinac_5240 PE=4 SV=1: AXE1 [Tuwongella immobilis]VTS00114.1 Acetyl xylan esterase (AXE1)/PhoPQ-activated pathogenicity-related protein OS=Singulisphaera acidiphila (strain ATCC BAA-1392 / DSM 18658 / VKM B-2454 / MOB10) GN=Sinac_5240 PE=4 SV=1: AXE1 [Tuwongella immobilis]